jgi:hypothetical protein
MFEHCSCSLPFVTIRHYQDEVDAILHVNRPVVFVVHLNGLKRYSSDNDTEAFCDIHLAFSLSIVRT